MKFRSHHFHSVSKLELAHLLSSRFPKLEISYLFPILERHIDFALHTSRIELIHAFSGELNNGIAQDALSPFHNFENPENVKILGFMQYRLIIESPSAR